jgi:hypothetical protein
MVPATSCRERSIGSEMDSSERERKRTIVILTLLAIGALTIAWAVFLIWLLLN